ncbi:hypothetical protein E2P81_ATG09084 [Venturia nashicola]|uniref:Uncharacterized protein n=1 Tax=Venturia nashicola TaxID=86259 RepID=A0A4Z1NFH0_9PEZI|nr:hypothetical protein E6O75_ATG09286 [Venturia nashicola]TLD20014.1 hypothetical protein E2P81_ATG09084 [Venturia nashicola]
MRLELSSGLQRPCVEASSHILWPAKFGTYSFFFKVFHDHLLRVDLQPLCLHPAISHPVKLIDMPCPTPTSLTQQPKLRPSRVALGSSYWSNDNISLWGS